MIIKVSNSVKNIAVKYTILSVFFVFLLSFSAYAAPKTANNYIYLQVNQVQHVGTMVDQTAWVPDLQTNGVNQTNSSITFRLFEPNFMSNFLVGYMIAGKYGVEMEYASYDLFAYKVNGELASNANIVNSNVRLEYVFFNFRQDFYEYKDINVFYKIGFGFVQPNFANQMVDGGANLDYGIAGSIGGYYALTDHIDLEVSYKLLGNYARRQELYSLGYEAKHKAIESSINWGIRFKLHSLTRSSDIATY
ncbi:MAG: hypothetical protein FWE18_04240 [Alphaproteobacteria bacterium]|nr:hypothetical protein [Alphaproteobacteria bacterium]